MLKKEQNRDQLQMWSLELLVSGESIVRIVDVLVEGLDLKALGFVMKGEIKNGAPAFHSKHLLKLYYYGYLNRVRSSRRLEREVKTNVEAMWLLKGLQPGYKTIANFRSENKMALQQVFKVLNQFLKSEGMFDEEVVAIDGSKFRAQNSKKNNYNEKKVKQHLDYIEKQTDEYLSELDRLDELEEESEIERTARIELSKQLDHLGQRAKKYNELEERVLQAREEGQTQVSTVDKDARSLPKKMNIIEVGYNVVTSVERKNKLITNYSVLNELDTYALSGVAKDAREVLGKEKGEELTALADKGFDTASELKECIENDIVTIVSPKKRVHAKKAKAYNKDAFEYDEARDSYRCPENHELTTNGRWYEKNNGKHRKSYKVQHYKLPFAVCNACPFKKECAGESNLKNSKGRYIERSEYQDYIDENIERVKFNKELYRERQAIVEHPFGTIKRVWGYDYTLLKGKEKVGGEFAIIFTCYNLRRAITILGMSELIKKIKEACLLLKSLIWVEIKRFKGILIKKIKYLNIDNPWKRTIRRQLCVNEGMYF